MSRYRYAPLKYVLFVAELGSVSVLSERQALDTIHAELKNDVPVREDLDNAVIARPDGTFSGAGGARFVDGAQHRAVVVGPSRVAVDTTDYTTFSEFAAFLERVVAAVAAIAPGRACRRLGLRYIDEIRVPGITRVTSPSGEAGSTTLCSPRSWSGLLAANVRSRAPSMRAARTASVCASRGTPVTAISSTPRGR